MDPKIVVTGGAGFIGSNLVKCLSTFHPTAYIMVVDHPLTEAKHKTLRSCPGVRFMEHDRFLELLDRGEIRPELIMHMGACSSTTESSWDYLEGNNLRYSQRLFLWCAHHNARLIYASSAATYGNGDMGFDDGQPISLLTPLNLYGKSKHDFDLWVEEQRNGSLPFPLQCVGLKFFNVFGPGESHKQRMASMVYHGWNQIRAKSRIQLFESHRSDFGHGDQLRDFIYIKDVVSVILQIFQRPEINGLFNLGTGIARSFNDLARTTFAAMELEPRLEYIPMPADLQGRYQYFTQAHMEKLRGTGIRYVPTSLEVAVADYVQVLMREGSSHSG